ncbi:MAG: HipA domain-containing protein [Nitrospirota bacterium]|jgi:serine/threonine-protein kinase HipA
MPDYQAVVWTRVAGEPVKMGSLYVTESEARFQYTAEFPKTALPGLSLVYPPAVYGTRPVVFRRPRQLHPRLRALIPPPGEHNFQRRLLLAHLRAQGAACDDPFAEDWALLTLAGHGGVGHVDCFADDDAARAWYGDTRPAPLVEVGERMGAALRDLIAWLDADAAALLQTLGPTPSVGGAVPKLLVAIPRAGWTGQVSAPTKGPDPSRIDVVLKLERSQAYPGLVELEAMALEVHAAAGFAVPRHWRCEVAGLPALAVERSDRDAEGRPIPFESWFAILAAGAGDITTPYDGSLDRIGRAIDTPAITLVGDRREAKRHLFRRLLVALLTGNGDLHLENLAVLGSGDAAGFSPVFDPTPMRAYSLHDMVTPLPFGDYGQLPDGVETPVGLTDAVARFARALGIRRDEAAELVRGARAATDDYVERVHALTTLPEPHKRRLEQICLDMRRRLADAAD